MSHVFSWLWLAWIAFFVIVEGTALKLGDKPSVFRTLSANLRALFHTETATGRLVWIITACIFFGWFVIHIATNRVY